MIKLKINFLVIELTRKCNLKCLHCMRGDAQNVDISKEVIDYFFEKYDYQITEINNLFFSGGEPSLGGEMANYICDVIKKNNIKLHSVSTILNGTIYDEKYVDALVNLGKICVENNNNKANVDILFSNDNFHPNINRKVYKKYRKLNKLKIVHTNHYYARGELNELNIIDIGKAKENKVGFIPFNYDQLLEPLNIVPFPNFTYIERIYLNALGYILKYTDGSYEIMDKNNLGNIKQKSLMNMK